MKPTMLKACTFFVLASGAAPALGQDVEFGVTDMERKQTWLSAMRKPRPADSDMPTRAVPKQLPQKILDKLTPEQLAEREGERDERGRSC